MSPRLDLDNFRLQFAVFEARYDAGFLHWDKAGTIWHEMISFYPTLKNVQAQPGITTFKIDSSDELAVEVSKMTVKAHNPCDSLLHMGELADRLVEVGASNLKLNEFSRLGLRAIYLRDYPTLDLATDDFFNLQLVRIPKGTPFVAEGKPANPEYSVRWENEHVGATVRAKVEPRKYQFEFPFGWEGHTDNVSEFFTFHFDVDYYTRTPVGVGQLNPSEWIAQSLRAIRRGARDIFSGE